LRSIKVIIWGMGAMGSGMAQMISQKKGIEVIGAVDTMPSKVGLDIADVAGLDQKTGVKISDDAQAVLSLDADIVLVATASMTKEVYPFIVEAVKKGKNVISTAEEMAYPYPTEPDLCRKMDSLAKEYGVSVLGTGINPGFVMDLLVIALTGSCVDVKKIKVTRVNDLSPFGPTVLHEQGVGMAVDDFIKGVEAGTVEGHVGFIQSIHMISDALGLEIDEIHQEREPIISKVVREEKGIRVEPGMIAGCRQLGYGMRNGEVVIEMEHPQQIHPHLENIETGDYIKLEGTPEIDLQIKPEIPGGIGTIAMLVNMIPQVINADPGLKTMLDLPLPLTYMDSMGKLIKDK